MSNTSLLGSFGGQGDSSLMFRNRIINGDMRIDQRNAGAAVTQQTGALFPVDRFRVLGSVSNKFTAQQNAGAVTPPAGFTHYLGMTSSAATTVGASDYYLLQHNLEGFNVADFGWGTANAQPVSISFWARSSLTGTHSGSFQNNAGDRSYVFTYSIAAANTWEYKTITVPGDTSGTWLKDNGLGIKITWSLGSGSTFLTSAGSWSAGNFFGATGSINVVGTSGATLYITGASLEAGPVATPFERRPIGTELALCQRYFEKSYNIGVNPGSITNPGAVSKFAADSADFYDANVQLKVTKRARPTLRIYSPGSGLEGRFYRPSTGLDVTALNNATEISENTVYFYSNGSLTANARYAFHWTADAEL